MVGRKGGEKIGRVRLFFSLSSPKLHLSKLGENETRHFGQNYPLHFEQNCLFLSCSSPITQVHYITFCLFLFAIHLALFKKLSFFFFFSFVSFNISLVFFFFLRKYFLFLNFLYLSLMNYSFIHKFLIKI